MEDNQWNNILSSSTPVPGIPNEPFPVKINPTGTRYRKIGSSGGHIEWEIPAKIPVDPEWTILGNLELPDWSLIGDPLFNVLAHKVAKNGMHQYAIGWEHPDPEKRADNPGFGFEDGFYLRSVDYIPVAYVIGALVGLEEVKYPPQSRAHAAMGVKETVSYRIGMRHFNNKPLWRFRGHKTWLPMEPDAEIRKVLKDLERRFIRQRLFEHNFDCKAIGWLYERSNTLYVSNSIDVQDLDALIRAAVLVLNPENGGHFLTPGVDLQVTMLGDDNRGTIPSSCLLLMLFNTDPDNIVAVNSASIPKGMTWGKLVEIVRLTKVWPGSRFFTRTGISAKGY